MIKKPIGETVMILNLSTIKVSPWDSRDSQPNKADTKCSLCAKGEPDNDEDAQWRDGDNDDSSDSEGKPHKTYHGDLFRNQDDTNDSLLAKDELADDEEDEGRDRDDDESIDSEGKPCGTCHRDSQHI